MNRIFTIVSIGILNINVVCTQTFDLVVNVIGIKEAIGYMQIGVYDNEDNYPYEGSQYVKKIFQVTDKNMAFTIRDLPKGKYALALHHDLDMNGVCDTNFLGIPKEPYGFYNILKRIFRVPKFEDTSFVLDKSKIIDVILMH